MSKLDDLGGLQAAKEWANEFPPSERRFPEALIEHIGELKRVHNEDIGQIGRQHRRLQAARKLADKLLAPSVVCHQGGVEYEIAYPPHEAVRVIKTQAREFLKMLEE